MDFLQVRLQAPSRSPAALIDFYGARLGLEQLEQTDRLVAFRIGETRLEFLASAGKPFYHLALLAPGDRFDGLLDWVGKRVALLPDRVSGELVFDFTSWDAHACYFHDPVGNIVEVIAHRGVGEAGARGSFAPTELLGVSELGLVGDTKIMARLLRSEIGLDLWDGTVEIEGGLAFVGEPAKTLILCPVGRPWLPTGRPAEPHRVEAVISGSPECEALVGAARHRIRRGTTHRSAPA
jgi:catechol 2,3-dioxygenase-like lactoylglutathione lyase family enzyme